MATFRYDILQGSEDWHELKWRKIGGTRSKGLFVDTDTLLLDMLSEFSEEYESEDGYESSDMLRGKELEPMARKALSDYAGIEFKECGWIQSDTHPILGISVDGISADETITAEIKCPARKRHVSNILNGVIPKDNICQSLHYFTVNPKCEKHYFASFRPESPKKLFIVVLTRESMIDIGWTKKTKVKEDRGLGEKEYVAVVPDIRSVSEWVEISKKSAESLQKQIDEKLLIINNKF